MGNEHVIVACSRKNCNNYNGRELFTCNECKEIDKIESEVLTKYIEAMKETTNQNMRSDLLKECKITVDNHPEISKHVIELINKTIESVQQNFINDDDGETWTNF